MRSGLLAPVALALSLALFGCGDRADTPAPIAPGPVAAVTSATAAAIDTSVPEEPTGGPLAAEPIDEPLVDNSSAPAAAHSIARALEARDAKALARLISAKPSLDTDDVARAEREFLLFGKAREWTRRLPLIERGLRESDPSASEVRVPLKVGGDLGTRTYTFQRSDRGWFLVLS